MGAKELAHNLLWRGVGSRRGEGACRRARERNSLANMRFELRWIDSDPTAETTVDPRGCPQLDITRELCGAAAMRKDAGLTPTRATETTIYTTQVNMISVELVNSRGDDIKVQYSTVSNKSTVNEISPAKPLQYSITAQVNSTLVQYSKIRSTGI